MKEYGYWLYSTMVQATAGLFGVLGMFIIFKLQSLKERMKDEEKKTIGVICRLYHLNYEALDRQIFEENEKFLLKEIEKCKKTLNLSDEEAIKNSMNSIDKNTTRKRLELLEEQRDRLQGSRSNYDILLKNGKETVKYLSLIFAFSIALLVFNPVFEYRTFISLTVLYMLYLVISLRVVLYLMKQALMS